MTKNIKNYVIQELEAYPRILRQISVLRYEMEHPAHVSAQEMLDAMTYACGDRTGSSPGHVSDICREKRHMKSIKIMLLGIAIVLLMMNIHLFFSNLLVTDLLSIFGFIFIIVGYISSDES